MRKYSFSNFKQQQSIDREVAPHTMIPDIRWRCGCVKWMVFVGAACIVAAEGAGDARDTSGRRYHDRRTSNMFSTDEMRETSHHHSSAASTMDVGVGRLRERPKQVFAHYMLCFSAFGGMANQSGYVHRCTCSTIRPHHMFTAQMVHAQQLP